MRIVPLGNGTFTALLLNDCNDVREDFAGNDTVVM